MRLHYWHPGIGDPTVIGWVITVVYFVAAYLCWKASRKERKQEQLNLWLILAILLLVLGINKQLDLQTPFIAAAKYVAEVTGFYSMRHVLQVSFVSFLAFLCFSFLMGIFFSSRNQWRKNWPALLGLFFLLAFVLIRAASFEHVNYFLQKWRQVGPVRMKYVVELGGICLVGFGAAIRLKNWNRTK